MGQSTESPRRTGGSSGQSTPGDEQHSAAGHPKTGAIGNSQDERAAERTPVSSGSHRRQAGQQVPTGMRVLSVVLALFGLLLSVLGLRVFLAGQGASAHDPTGGSPAVAGAGVLVVAIGVGYFTAAHGTWTLKPWGWTLAIGLLGTGALSSLLVLTSSASSAGLAGLVVNGGLCWYLYSNRRLYQRLARAGGVRKSTS